MDNWTIYLPQFLPGLITFLGSLFAWKKAHSEAQKSTAEAGKARAETRKIEINGQTVILDNLRNEVNRLAERQGGLEIDNEALEKRVEELEQENKVLRAENVAFALCVEELQKKYSHVLEWARERGYVPPAHW